MLAFKYHRRGLLRSAKEILRSNGALIMTRTHSNIRGLATAARDDGKLPLKGYKVLDMTRVLAGVSKVSIQSKEIH